jgi:hypothetical protein
MTDDGGFLLGGTSNSPEAVKQANDGILNGNKTQACLGHGDYWIIKIDDKGNEQWQKVLGGKGDDQLAVAGQLANGNYIFGGSSNSETGESKIRSNESGTDFWVVMLDKDQNEIWQQTYNIGKEDILASLFENEDHSLLLGGYSQGEHTKNQVLKKAGKLAANQDKEPKVKKGTGDYVAIKINTKGEELWRKSVGSETQDVLRKVIETRDGGYLMAGTSRGKSDDRNSSIGGNDFWVVKLKDKDKPKKDPLSVEAIPNPAADFTNVIVGYDFEKGSATLVDLAGHVLQQFPITERTVPIDLNGLPEGIYIVNIKTDVQSSGVKIIKTNKN